MTGDSHTPLYEDIRFLDSLLTETLQTHTGHKISETVASIRTLAKHAREGHDEAFDTLLELLAEIPAENVFPVARTFTHFHRLANIAEQYHRVRHRRSLQREPHALPPPGSCAEVFTTLLEAGVSGDELHRVVCGLEIELVLTAHPTESMRRTLIQKYLRIARALETRERSELTPEERENVVVGLRRELAASWASDDVRRQPPTPFAEAKWGLAIIEQTLWDAVPRFLRSLDRALYTATGKPLPVEAAPIRFGSWMGGDRDGNPNVTPEVTEKVCLIARLTAVELFAREIDALRWELSMVDASPELRTVVGSAREPYRELLHRVYDRLRATRRYLEARLEEREADDTLIYTDPEDFAEPLRLCYRSLVVTGDELNARGRLLDVLRRLQCFGLILSRLDVRQEAGRHTDVLDAVTRYLGLGSYATWDEEERLQFLLTELESRRPLIPDQMPMAEPVRDVLDTFKITTRQPPGTFGAYVISMAKAPSDVLAVELLQKAAGVRSPLRVVPLFETEDDLRQAGNIIRRLLDIRWYRHRIGGRQEVMIGYSDSTKDVGKLAAMWALYQAQEQIVEACREREVHLTLFHGRGGTVGRGGGPTALAFQSQPPGSIQGRLRVTEQGERIQAKFGLPGIATRSLEVYTTATLQATLSPPCAPRQEWRRLMDQLAEMSKAAYRAAVYDNPDFAAYFRAATPVEELSHLNIGSRPARRKPDASLTALRAIPWIFAWTQNRLMTPSWLGVGEALNHVSQEGQQACLREMYTEWPLFHSMMDLIEMVLAKADPQVAALYDRVLVPERYRALGQQLHLQFSHTVETVLTVIGHTELLEDTPVLRRSILARNPYIIPLNLLQVELLGRIRETGDAEGLRDALLMTISGIAAGMRNTG